MPRRRRGGPLGTGAVGGGPSAGSSPPGPPRCSSEMAADSSASAPIQPPLPLTEDRHRHRYRLEASRRVVTRDLEVLSRGSGHDSSSLVSLHRCLRLLPLLVAHDPILAARCYRGLLAYLGAILSRDDPSPSLLPAIEVFAEYLALNVPLRRKFAMADCAASEGARIFAEALSWHGDHHILLELVCHHFISSWPDQEGFKAFLSELSLSGNMMQGTTEGISFQGSILLFKITRLFSVPAIVQAHLLLLVSRCISDKNLDMNLLAFDCAMNVCATYLPARCAPYRTGGVKTPLSYLGEGRPFNCCIKDATDEKLRSQINKLFSFCQLHSADEMPIDESDIDCLIEEDLHMLHGEVSQKAIMDVKRMLPGILFRAKQKKVHEADAEVSDEIFWLAAVLRLMCSSLKHILPHFSQKRSANDKCYYNAILESICLLGKLEANEFHRYDLPGTVGNPMGSESASMVMLAHFASLSIYCVRRRLRFLLKSCIIMMIMAMNLIHEEESLGTFQLSADVSKEAAAFCSTRDEVHKDRNDYGDGSSSPWDMQSSSIGKDRASRRQLHTTQSDDAEMPDRDVETEDAEGRLLPDEAGGARKSSRTEKPNPKYIGETWRRTTQADGVEKPEGTAESEGAEGSLLPDEAGGARKSSRARKPNRKYIGEAWRRTTQADGVEKPEGTAESEDAEAGDIRKSSRARKPNRKYIGEAWWRK